MKIWTSYYGMLSRIKKEHPDYFLVATSGMIPKEIEAAVDSWNQSLAPSKSIFLENKENPDWEQYVKRFKSERLPKIDWLEKLELWEEKANKSGKTIDNIVLLCYETADSGDGKGEFCHRHILSETIEKEFNTTVEEIGYENYDRINYRMVPKFNTDFLF